MRTAETIMREMIREQLGDALLHSRPVARQLAKLPDSMIYLPAKEMAKKLREAIKAGSEITIGRWDDYWFIPSRVGLRFRVAKYGVGVFVYSIECGMGGALPWKRFRIAGQEYEVRNG